MDNIKGSVLVVGAGIGGIRSALDLAEIGHRVILIDKSPKLAGYLSQLDHQFPNDHCGMCRMLPMEGRDVGSQYCLRKGLFHENIEIMLATELIDLQGEPGSFTVTLRQIPPLVDQQRCIGCGECVRVCPVEVKSEFDAGLSLRKAIYLPTLHTTPSQYLVDSSACTRCGQCEAVCPTKAVNLGLHDRKAFKVLVVDDEMIVRDSIQEWLLDEGFEAETAGSGDEAVKKLAEQEYGLMLLDVKMPGMDGVETLKRGKELRPEMPVMMMTAYATVETAVEAMKFGARDYLMKPFDPEIVVSLVKDLYEAAKPKPEKTVQVGAMVLATGFGLADPASGVNTYGYGELPGVVTSLELERLMSPGGPTRGALVRPSDGQPVRKIAWLQCAGSRNIEDNADYCSSICCMFSIKEALLAKKRVGASVDTAIFYMDMRTFGKDFQRYRDAAEEEAGVRFVRSRVHSVDREGNGLRLHYVDRSGELRTEDFDLVVLATGQRPSPGAEELAERLGLELNPWGFCRLGSATTSRTTKEGVFAGGSFSGAKDISESIIQAGAASCAASTLIRSKGIWVSPPEQPELRDVSRELPNLAAVVCSCGGLLGDGPELEALTRQLREQGIASMTGVIDRLCSPEGWEAVMEKLRESRCNRVVIGACLPHAYGMKVKELGRELGLGPALIEWVDLLSQGRPHPEEDSSRRLRRIHTLLDMGAAKVKEVEPALPEGIEVSQQALVIGGGIAGMTAALAIADHGFDVSLVEKEPVLGGNLRSIHWTLQGFSPRELLEKTIARVQAHPRIQVRANARVVRSSGQVGQFTTTLVSEGVPETVTHGVTLVATGGHEAKVHAYGYGESKKIVTQHELEERLQTGALKSEELGSVVMIQCVGSREGERRYCSRICCASALKNALYLKEKSPDVEVYVLYRDMMAYGFLESRFTEARRSGVVFIQYDLNEKPTVELVEGEPVVTVRDPVLERRIQLRPDVLALSTGIVPEDSRDLASLLGVSVNDDGFFQELDYKWRPLDLGKSGVFVCGVAHSPRSVDESIAMAEACAERALSILSHKQLKSSSTVAEVRHSLCSLCERCISACPYGVRWKDGLEEMIVVNEAACQGCGACAAACPNGASVLRGYEDRQVLAVIDAAVGDLGYH